MFMDVLRVICSWICFAYELRTIHVGCLKTSYFSVLRAPVARLQVVARLQLLSFSFTQLRKNAFKQASPLMLYGSSSYTRNNKVLSSYETNIRLVCVS